MSWLHARPESLWRGQPLQAYEDASWHHDHSYVGERDHAWPGGVASFGRKLTQASESLRALGIDYASSSSNGARWLSFDSARYRARERTSETVQ